MKGQKMIQTLARKRTQLGALAVLAALVVTLFAAVQFAAADNHKVVIEFDDSDGVVADGDDVGVMIKATVNTDTTTAPGAGTISWVRVSGGLSVTPPTTIDPLTYVRVDADDTEAPFAWSVTNSQFTIVNPKGTASGTYTVSAMVDPDGSGDLKARTITAVLTVGDPGDGLGSASLVVTDADGKPNASKNAAPADGGTIYLTVQAMNSRGEKSNNSDVSQMIIYARGGDITLPAGIDGTSPADGDFTDDEDRAENTTNANALTASPANAKESFRVTAGGNVAASVDVYVTLIGPSGVVTSDTETISFTGPADAISVSDPSGPLGQSGAEITIEVTASDKAGTGVALGPDDVSAVVKDASGDDPTVGTTHQKGDNDRDGCRDGTRDASDNALLSTADGCTTANNGDDARTDDNENNFTTDPTDTYSEKPFDAKTVVVPVSTGAEKADPGEYTVVVTFGEDETEVTIHVAGPAANIEASTDADGPISIGQVIEVTATVTDADGIAVQNAIVDSDPDMAGDQTVAQPVTFTAVGALELRTIRNEISTTVGTKDGVSKASFVVTKGSGTATIIVSAGDASTFVSLSDASTDPVEEVEEISAANCLNSVNSGPAVWTCEGNANASDIFPALNSRGATALWLWNGSSWQRYSVRDGAEIPGSTDFMMQNLDSLWISY
ncbi:MAG: hypothetical protein F4Z38_05445 [Chloroflexi bacterium]|nr:hypothetical protein [Chloroflexota bacterium]